MGDPHTLDLRCLVNGEERQHSNTKHLIFDCYDAIAHLSQAFTLDVGDVLFMGTPAGVGAAMKPPVWLVEGDVVRVEIESSATSRTEWFPRRPEPSSSDPGQPFSSARGCAASGRLAFAGSSGSFDYLVVMSRAMSWTRCD